MPGVWLSLPEKLQPASGPVPRSEKWPATLAATGRNVESEHLEGGRLFTIPLHSFIAYHDFHPASPKFSPCDCGEEREAAERGAGCDLVEEVTSSPLSAVVRAAGNSWTPAWWKWNNRDRSPSFAPAANHGGEADSRGRMPMNSFRIPHIVLAAALLAGAAPGAPVRVTRQIHGASGPECVPGSLGADSVEPGVRSTPAVARRPAA